MRRTSQENVPVKVLGAGANVLIRDDGFDGVVVRLDQPGFRRETWSGDEVEVGGGVNLMSFSKSCSENGISGLEGLAGIPATIGGAIRMNAGGHNGEIKDVVSEVEVVHTSGSRERLNRDQVGFDYRRTDLKDRIVVGARLSLRRDDPQKTRLRYAENFGQKRRTQPMAERSAGCVFKNPPGRSAGALIDQAGLKGTVCGGARVSARHANFIVADSTATSSDVLRLIDLIRDRVALIFGTVLRTEIEIW